MSDYELEDAHFGAGTEPAEAYVEPELPPDDADEATWDAWLAEVDEEPEPEQEEWINPLEDYPAEGPPVGVFEQGLVAELRQQGLGEAYANDIAGYVREAAAAPEFGITDEQAIGRVTSEILAGRQELFRSWLGQGASVNQAIQALGDLNIEEAIRVGLAAEHYRAVTQNTSVGQWRAGREAAARKAAMAGEPPPEDIMDSPSIARMRRAMEARAERMAAQQELRRAHGLGDYSGL